MSFQTGIAHSPTFSGPLYMQVAAILRTKICGSEWTPRAPLPNEVVLARDVGVSIGTMRKALELLEDEHLIERRQGRGTYVVETSLETELERFSNVVVGSAKVRAHGVAWTVTTGEASAAESAALNIVPGAAVYRLEAVWSAANGTTARECVTVSAGRFPDLPKQVSEGGQFLFPLYRRLYREAIGKVSEALTCVNADADLATKLNVPHGQALLHVSRIAFNVSGHPVEWSQRTMHMANAEYVVTMG
ncbi:MAG: GntR family transcriptional regulator [Hyphomicrobium sp.]